MGMLASGVREPPGADPGTTGATDHAPPRHHPHFCGSAIFDCFRRNHPAIPPSACTHTVRSIRRDKRDVSAASRLVYGGEGTLQALPVQRCVPGWATRMHRLSVSRRPVAIFANRDSTSG
jgi:hypothetical protein